MLLTCLQYFRLWDQQYLRKFDHVTEYCDQVEWLPLILASDYVSIFKCYIPPLLLSVG